MALGRTPLTKKAPQKGAFSVSRVDAPAAQWPVALSTLIDTPGPIVELIDTFFI